ncbi:MAG: hypothetical protein KGZ88_17230 [Methylomicrobium sp.]|nr:hypothetical protein [Methylomicrobium sp.]
MMPRTHMQDQVHDRIKDIMGEKRMTVQEVGQHLTNLAVIVVFLLIGLNW